MLNYLVHSIEVFFMQNSVCSLSDYVQHDTNLSNLLAFKSCRHLNLEILDSTDLCFIFHENMTQCKWTEFSLRFA